MAIFKELISKIEYVFIVFCLLSIIAYFFKPNGIDFGLLYVSIVLLAITYIIKAIYCFINSRRIDRIAVINFIYYFFLAPLVYSLISIFQRQPITVAIFVGAIVYIINSLFALKSFLFRNDFDEIIGAFFRFTFIEVFVLVIWMLRFW